MCLAFCTLYVERGATPALHLKGGDGGGGAPESSVGATKEGGQGGRWGGGHQRAVWEQQRVDWFPLLGSLKNLTTGLIWLVRREGGGGKRGGGGPGRAGKGGAECGSTMDWFRFCSLKT